MNINHIAIYVENLEKEREFFETYFGGKAGDKYYNAKTGFTSYFISFDNGARLEIMNVSSSKAGMNQHEKIGYIHMAFSVGSKETVDKLTERLRADSFVVVSEPRTTGDGYYESCIQDYEGNIIEITI